MAGARRRIASTAVPAVVLMALFGASPALAQSAAPGFTETTYASGYVTNGGGHGPRGIAFKGNVLWAVDQANGGSLYSADAGVAGPGPATSLTAVKVNSSAIGSGITGVAIGKDGRIYASLSAPTNTVVELDPSSGAIVRTLTTASGPGQKIPCPNSLATDPLSGDLIVTSCDFIYRVKTPATTPMAVLYAGVSDGTPIQTHAISIAPDGTIFVSASTQVWQVPATSPPITNPVPVPVYDAPSGTITGVAVITDGVTTAPRYLFVSASDGTITKAPLPGSPGATLSVVSGATASDQMTVGPDKCVYASTAAIVIRIADTAGTCRLAAAGIPVPTMTLTNTSGQAPRINDGAQTVSAVLNNASNPIGIQVTFTITASPGGINGRTVTLPITAGNSVSYSYTSTTVETDTIVASATVDGFSVVSNPVIINWGPAPDLTPPSITFTITGGVRAPNFSCPQPTTGLSTPNLTVTCGWWTTPPTFHWIVTGTGPSGLGTITNCQDFTLTAPPPIQGTSTTCTATNGQGLATASYTLVVNALFSAPTITATATTADGKAYTFGTPTNQAVTVHFICTGAIAGAIASCPADRIISGGGTFDISGTVVDIAGQTVTRIVGTVVIVPSTQPSKIRITSAATLPTNAVNVSALLTKADGVTPLANKTVTFAVGTQVVTATTNTSGVARATLTLKPGTYVLTAAFSGDTQYLSSQATQTLTVTKAEKGEKDKDKGGDKDNDGKDKDGKDKDGDSERDGRSGGEGTKGGDDKGKGK